MVMRERVITKAPARIDFAGGPTDVPPFSTLEWGYVVNAAINRWAKIELKSRSDSTITITSEDLHLSESYPSFSSLARSSSLKLITTAIELLEIEHGLDVIVQTDVPPGSGLAGSSSISVALLYALHILQGDDNISQEMLAQESIYHEMDRLHNIVGGQDEYASAFGGVQSFRFADGAISRKKLPVPPETLDSLSDSLLLCYSGISRISGQILDQVMQRYSLGDPATIQQLHYLRATALEIERYMMSGNISPAIEHLSTIWHAQRSLDAAVSTPEIETIFDIGLANGATGGKVAGAGGGGCVLLTCAPFKKSAVEQALRTAGFSIIPFQFITSGVELVSCQ